jgi:endonuclease YncB( thermonuclease family)
MKDKYIVKGLFVCAVVLSGLLPAFAGDSLFGKVTEVRSASVVVLDYGTGQYIIDIMGVTVPKEGPIASEAKQFVESLVLGKNARMRLGSRLENGEMSCQLLTADPEVGIKDVGLELVRSGLAQRKQGEDYQFGYKYGELTKAENEAREAKRGIWAQTQPK